MCGFRQFKVSTIYMQKNLEAETEVGPSFKKLSF